MQFFRFTTNRQKRATTSLVVTASSFSNSSRRNCSSSGAAADVAAEIESSSKNDRFLAFSNTTFVLSQIDYCAKLAAEANLKHGVPANVPPQACPDTFDHKVVYCETLGKRALDPSSFAYPVQFEPPPKHIPGMETPKSERQLLQEQQEKLQGPVIVGKKKSPAAGTATATTAATSTSSSSPSPSPAAPPAPFLSDFPNPFKIQKYSEMHNIASSGMDGFSMNAWKEYAEKMPNTARQVDYPTDDEIDTLLLQVWDPVVSKRVAEFTKLNPNFVFRECKEYIIADANSDDLKRSKLKISDAVLRGESAKVKLPGVSPEHQIHFNTPFTAASLSSAEDGTSTDHLSPPKLSKYADRNAFECTECPLKFRTYDGLKEHYSQDHRGKSIAVAKDLEFRDASFRQQNASVSTIAHQQLKSKLALLKEQKKRQLEEKLKKHQPALASGEELTESLVDGARESSSSSTAAADSPSLVSPATAVASPASATLSGESAIKSTPLPEVGISLHSRSFSNIHLVGIVRQVQTGYAGNDYVAELLVETNLSYPESGSDNTVESSSMKDVFTVRCFGEEFANATADSIDEGSSTTVLIRGTYKQNLHIDRASGKPQCFPFVKVAPPFGSVSVVNVGTGILG